ncbi:MAG: hypothetical protein ROR55_28730 [Devosia sp.]
MNELTPYAGHNGQIGPPGPPLPLPPQPPSEDDVVGAANLRASRKMAIGVSVSNGVAVGVGLFGVLADESAFVRFLIVGVVAPVVTVVFAGLWHILLGVASRPQASRPVIGLIVSAGLMVSAASIGTSSWLMAAVIGGGAAVQHHQSQVLDRFTDVLGKAGARHERERIVLSHLSRAEGALQRLHDCEVDDGCISGTPGPGAVARELEREIAAFQEAAREMEEAFSRRPRLLAHVRGQIELAQQASRAGDEETFTRAINSVTTGLSGADATDPTLMLQTLNTDSRVPAVQNIYDRLRRSMDGVGEFIAPIKMPTYTPIDRASATIHYAGYVPFAWGVALAVDLLPMALLLLLLLASHRMPQPVQPVPYDYDYDELERLRRILTEEEEDEVTEAEPVEEAPPATRPRGRPRKSRGNR